MHKLSEKGKSIRVILMICYAGSGGTLLNKCLGSLSSSFVLSEVNPVVENSTGKLQDLMREQSIEWQAKAFLNRELMADGYANKVAEVGAILEKDNKKLMVRDWTFLNFTKCVMNSFKPSMQLDSLNLLPQGMDVTCFVFLRNTIDVWISCNYPPIDEFCEDYGCFLNRLAEQEMPIFKYEEFCSNPKGELKRLCEYVDIEYEDEFFSTYTRYDKVTGDDLVKGGSRGKHAGEISRLQRKRIPRKRINEIEKCKKIHKLNEMLGYKPGYYSEEVEPLLKGWLYSFRMIRALLLYDGPKFLIKKISAGNNQG